MSHTIENNMDRHIAFPLNNLVNYLTQYELHSPAEGENIVLQRLKVLASSSNQCVGFRCINESTYHVFSSHEHIPDEYKLGEIAINEIMPVRSAVFTVEDNGNIKISDYSIERVTNITNFDFLSKLCVSKESTIDHDIVTFDYLDANESYEGTVLVARYTSSGWVIRTTSCYDARESYFGSDSSHYDMLLSVVPDVEEKLTDLKAQYENDVYFVFVLVSAEQKYLCDYGTSKLVLINVRNADTHEELPVDKLADWYDISKKVSSDDVNNSLKLEDNEVFNNTFLGLQGYIVKDHNGHLYRTYTLAYQYGLRTMSNHSSLFLNGLHCYLKNSFATLVAMKGMTEDDAKCLAGHCKLMLNGMRNIFAYMYTAFTTLQLRQNDTGVDEHGVPTYNISKSFVKKNGGLYAKVFDHSASTMPYGKLLAMLQKYSLSSRHFKESYELANDVEKFIRSLAHNDTSIQLLFDALINYRTFKEHLITSTQQYKTENPRCTIRVYNYNGEEMFLSVLDERVHHTRRTIDVEVSTIDVNTSNNTHSAEL